MRTITSALLCTLLGACTQQVDEDKLADAFVKAQAKAREEDRKRQQEVLKKMASGNGSSMFDDSGRQKPAVPSKSASQ
jgi:hypothetical protein